MTILNQLASASNRSDQGANVDLAERISLENDDHAVAELVRGLLFGKKAIQQDCIKVLYEVGARKPTLIAEFSDQFAGLLKDKNNRLQWGAMTALSGIADHQPELVYEYLKSIEFAADHGSVITRDHAVKIMISLCSVEAYADECFDLLNTQLGSCPTNQLPMYAESAVTLIDESRKAGFIKTLESRLPEIGKASKKKRIEKVIRSLQS